MASDSFQFQPGNPFAADLAPEGPLTDEGSPALHTGALEDLEESLGWARSQPSEAVGRGGGQVVLLRAPRAGFGKSHLLARLQGRSVEDAFSVFVSFDPEGGVGWKSALRQVLACWHAAVAGGAITTLDHISRRVFSLMNADLIRAGRVPCAQPDQALAALDRDYAVMFDFGDPRQPVARWFQDHFESLLAAAMPRMQAMTALAENILAIWLRALCGYAQGGAEGDPRRLETLEWAIRQPMAVNPNQTGGLQWLTAVSEGEGFHRQMLTALCRLAAACRPVVVMLDHLDGFYKSEDDLLRLGRLIADWRRLSGRTVLVLSVNEDLWTGTFQKALPSALEDRLTGAEVSLGGITPEEAASLIGARLTAAQVPPAVAQSFTAGLDLAGWIARQALQGSLLSPRVVLRHAARRWKEYWKPASASAPESPPASPPPVAFPSAPPATPPKAAPLSGSDFRTIPFSASAPAPAPPVTPSSPPPSAPAAFSPRAVPGSSPSWAAPAGERTAWPALDPSPSFSPHSPPPYSPPPTAPSPRRQTPPQPPAFSSPPSWPAAGHSHPAPAPPARAASPPFEDRRAAWQSEADPAIAPYSAPPAPVPSRPPPAEPSREAVSWNLPAPDTVWELEDTAYRLPPASTFTDPHGSAAPLHEPSPVYQPPAAWPPWSPSLPEAPTPYPPSAYGRSMGEPPPTRPPSRMIPPMAGTQPFPAPSSAPPSPPWMPQGSLGHHAPQDPAPARNWLAHSLPEYTLAGRFQQLRAHFASAARLGLDHDRLHRLIKWSGQRLAVVRYAEAPLPGPPGRKAAVWQSPDGEILFGIQPHSDHAYWSALLQLARQRREQVASCRLVLFSAAAAPMDPALWLMHPDEAAAARARFLDIQTLDHAELATLYATDEVLREAERGTLAVGSSDAFAAMAPYLEFFWKRLTRPLRPG